MYLFVCLYPKNVKTAEPIGPKFFVGHLGILKIREIFCENPRIIFVLFYDVHKENMFRTNLEDGREAPSKASFVRNLNKMLIILNVFQEVKDYDQPYYARVLLTMLL